MAHNIRRQVFVVEQEISEAIEIDEFEDSATHILAFYVGRPVGTARWRTTGQGVKLERFAVLKEFRSNKIGQALLDFSLRQVDLSKPVYLNAQVSVITFYEKYGFSVVGPVFMEADIPHKKMVLERK